MLDLIELCYLIIFIILIRRPVSQYYLFNKAGIVDAFIFSKVSFNLADIKARLL
ncbi:hypothetical protein EV13_0086 [Prochlorococcus sp. MIT 0702]|nr:hypothetical protein EV13_0086 [Prochlorococcus sp. MIT 0702]